MEYRRGRSRWTRIGRDPGLKGALGAADGDPHKSRCCNIHVHPVVDCALVSRVREATAVCVAVFLPRADGPPDQISSGDAVEVATAEGVEARGHGEFVVGAYVLARAMVVAHAVTLDGVAVRIDEVVLLPVNAGACGIHGVVFEVGTELVTGVGHQVSED